MIRKMIIVVSMTLLIISQGILGKQELRLNKDEVVFNIHLKNPGEVTLEDTIQLEVTIINNRRKPIVIPDWEIPGKPSPFKLFVNDNLEIVLDLGGSMLAKMGMIRKFQIIKPGEKVFRNFYLPVSQYVSRNEQQKQSKVTSPFLKDVPIIVLAAYSDSELFLSSNLKGVIEFDDYWGTIKGWEGSGIEMLVEMFRISGITIKIDLQ